MMDKNIDIEELKNDIRRLRKELLFKEQLLQEKLLEKDRTSVYNDQLTTSEIIQYSRQMIMPEMSLKGQTALKHSKVLIVGAGGLGCPAAMYLVRAGIGEITIIDYDEVELSNLHRQILYTEFDIGTAKVQSAYNILKRVNNHVKIIPLCLHVNRDTIKEIVVRNRYNVVIDGSDNVATRYLLNDVCVMNDIPLVSGSALQMEGQLTVYHYKDGPCYRCLFPVPPPPETVTSCGDGGVLGPIPGVVGVLQALETIKLLINLPGVLSSRLLLIDGSSATFRSVKLRSRNPGCAVCGDQPTITSLIDYEQFCGSKGYDKTDNIDILEPEETIDVEEFARVSKYNIVLDVRPVEEYHMCYLPTTINFPFTRMQRDDWVEEIKRLFQRCSSPNLEKGIFLYCSIRFM
ncbi:adenylyltransferase and sulfurtransferase MOCS3 isoform X2 [Anoplophora glabripennis]|uniref:adenylyltransferase and sulfurtransferase MOCS3 isoform X2 n=1 Tax=Anoplophora glabripennis TaxID=217634 RepID=UPI000873EDAB|nr:adenylyltransferase and sulfurtransferase MOCS3 isoform X2 [Anoplophora glabripennis]